MNFNKASELLVSTFLKFRPTISYAILDKVSLTVDYTLILVPSFAILARNKLNFLGGFVA